MKTRGRPRHPDVLTPREWEVLALLREGLSNPEIAERLGISRNGVKYHVSEILSKLGLESREAAAGWRATTRPWWAVAAAPLALVWRRAGPAIAGAVAVVALGGLAFLAALIACTGGGDASSSPSSGPQLAYLDAEGSLWLADAEGNKNLWTDDPQCGDAPQLSWSANGERLACWSPGEDGRISNFYRSPDGHRSGEGTGTASDLQAVHWSPASNKYVYLHVPHELAAAGNDASEVGYEFFRVSGTGGEGGGSDPVLLMRTPDPLMAHAFYGFPLWAPDGARLAYASPGGQLRVRNFDTAEDVVVSIGGYTPLAWALGGTALLVAENYQPPVTDQEDYRASYAAYLIDPQSGDTTRVGPLDNGTQFWLSADGSSAALFRRDSSGANLLLLDLTTLSLRPIEGSPIFSGSSNYITSESVRFSADGQDVYWIGAAKANVAVYRASVRDPVAERLTRPGTSGWFSTDLSHIAYTELSPEGRVTLYIANIDGSRPVEIASVTPGAITYAWRPTIPERGDVDEATDGGMTQPGVLRWERSYRQQTIQAIAPGTCGDDATAQQYGVPRVLRVDETSLGQLGPLLLGLEAEPYTYDENEVNAQGEFILSPEGWEMSWRRGTGLDLGSPNRFGTREVFLRRLDEPDKLFRYFASFCNQDDGSAVTTPTESYPPAGDSLVLPEDVPAVLEHVSGDYLSLDDAVEKAHAGDGAEVVVAELGHRRDLELLGDLDWSSIPPAGAQVYWFMVLRVSLGPVRPGAEYAMQVAVDASGADTVTSYCCVQLTAPGGAGR